MYFTLYKEGVQEGFPGLHVKTCWKFSDLHVTLLGAGKTARAKVIRWPKETSHFDVDIPTAKHILKIYEQSLTRHNSSPWTDEMVNEPRRRPSFLLKSFSIRE